MRFIRNWTIFIFKTSNILYILWSTSVKPKLYEKVWNQTPTRQTIGLVAIVTTQDNRNAMGEKIADHNSGTVEWLPVRFVQVFSLINFRKWKGTTCEKNTSRFIQLCDKWIWAENLYWTRFSYLSNAFTEFIHMYPSNSRRQGR